MRAGKGHGDPVSGMNNRVLWDPLRRKQVRRRDELWGWDRASAVDTGTASRAGMGVGKGGCDRQDSRRKRPDSSSSHTNEGATVCRGQNQVLSLQLEAVGTPATLQGPLPQKKPQLLRGNSIRDVLWPQA